ncbi:MAG: anti-anti-sigma factor [candidate division Zixibacteria bacterium 4484_95]|nr:MAG: anti-anti-sigma factor [candidate division Zixibacteria bacterium 4484_95]RKX20272.1 MAG: anti-sigma factor antagonist [candidate division Zixibacteria bacterium]
MKLSSREENGITILEPKGKMMGGPDTDIFHDKLHELVSHNKKKVIIDLSNVEWMNSRGLGILISGLTTMRNNGGELKLACVTNKIESLLTITRLITAFENYDSVDEAVKSFS